MTMDHDMIHSPVLYGRVCFKRGDLFFKAQDVTKLIHAIQQTGLIEWINGERDRTIRVGEGLRCEINRQFGMR